MIKIFARFLALLLVLSLTMTSSWADSRLTPATTLSHATVDDLTTQALTLREDNFSSNKNITSPFWKLTGKLAFGIFVALAPALLAQDRTTEPDSHITSADELRNPSDQAILKMVDSAYNDLESEIKNYRETVRSFPPPGNASTVPLWTSNKHPLAPYDEASVILIEIKYHLGVIFQYAKNPYADVTAWAKKHNLKIPWDQLDFKKRLPKPKKPRTPDKKSKDDKRTMLWLSLAGLTAAMAASGSGSLKKVMPNAFDTLRLFNEAPSHELARILKIRLGDSIADAWVLFRDSQKTSWNSFEELGNAFGGRLTQDKKQIMLHNLENALQLQLENPEPLNSVVVENMTGSARILAFVNNATRSGWPAMRDLIEDTVSADQLFDFAQTLSDARSEWGSDFETLTDLRTALSDLIRARNEADVDLIMDALAPLRQKALPASSVRQEDPVELPEAKGPLELWKPSHPSRRLPDFNPIETEAVKLFSEPIFPTISHLAASLGVVKRMDVHLNGLYGAYDWSAVFNFFKHSSEKEFRRRMSLYYGEEVGPFAVWRYRNAHAWNTVEDVVFAIEDYFDGVRMPIQRILFLAQLSPAQESALRLSTTDLYAPAAPTLSEKFQRRADALQEAAKKLEPIWGPEVTAHFEKLITDLSLAIRLDYFDGASMPMLFIELLRMEISGRVLSRRGLFAIVPVAAHEPEPEGTPKSMLWIEGLVGASAWPGQMASFILHIKNSPAFDFLNPRAHTSVGAISAEDFIAAWDIRRAISQGADPLEAYTEAIVRFQAQANQTSTALAELHLMRPYLARALARTYLLSEKTIPESEAESESAAIAAPSVIAPPPVIPTPPTISPTRPESLETIKPTETIEPPGPKTMGATTIQIPTSRNTIESIRQLLMGRWRNGFLPSVMVREGMSKKAFAEFTKNILTPMADVIAGSIHAAQILNPLKEHEVSVSLSESAKGFDLTFDHDGLAYDAQTLSSLGDRPELLMGENEEAIDITSGLLLEIYGLNAVLEIDSLRLSDHPHQATFLNIDDFIVKPGIRAEPGTTFRLTLPHEVFGKTAPVIQNEPISHALLHAA